MLAANEWSLSYGDVYTRFGTERTPVFNVTTPDLGDTEIAASDTPRPRADGVAFGVDFRGGRTVAFDLGVRGNSEVDVRSHAADLARTWRGDGVRDVPGAVAELRANYSGRERLIYGRPRKYAAITKDANQHYIAVVADFAAVDDVFYDGAESTRDISLAPSSTGGLSAPLASPLSTVGDSTSSAGITVVGELPAWPVVEIRGPIVDPVVEVLGAFRFELRATLAYDDVVEIDARPWCRTILRNGGGNLAGSLTRTSTRLARSGIPPGTHALSLRGQDASGSASASLTWRPAYTSL